MATKTTKKETAKKVAATKTASKKTTTKSALTEAKVKGMIEDAISPFKSSLDNILDCLNRLQEPAPEPEPEEIPEPPLPDPPLPDPPPGVLFPAFPFAAPLSAGLSLVDSGSACAFCRNMQPVKTAAAARTVMIAKNILFSLFMAFSRVE